VVFHVLFCLSLICYLRGSPHHLVSVRPLWLYLWSRVKCFDPLDQTTLSASSSLKIFNFFRPSFVPHLSVHMCLIS
jgi:hypothetical protein